MSTITREEKEAAKLAEYARRDELVFGLRALADLYEENGVDKLPLPDHGITITIDTTVHRPSTKPGAESWHQEADPEASNRALKKAIRGMGRGKKEKFFGSFSFWCDKKLSTEVKLRIECTREGICRKVFTGNKIVHAPTTNTYTTEERVEEEFEWVCDDPLLATAQDRS